LLKNAPSSSLVDYVPKITNHGGVIVLKELIEYNAKALVDNPDQVTVEEIEGETTSTIELRVAQGDMKNVIGEKGKSLKSMRTILAAVAVKVGKKASLELIEKQ
jgi:uncharacterized protein